ncbi:MAG TPA: imidazole glycerol phosphate synthase subunit HisF [bacterium]|nr:imidazole glycerol phosphate synthase subunit HisF [bacterium]
MTAKRIIPCLDVRNGRVVKGVRFLSLRESGDPAALALEYERQGADEIVFLDITATIEKRPVFIQSIRKTAEHLFTPLSAGGGVRHENDARALLENGADKFTLNTAAVENPALIERCARCFGSQAVVVAVDAAGTGKHRKVAVRAGRCVLDLNAVDWARRAADCGAGEILLTSIDRDGTQSGYDLDLIHEVSSAVPVPVIASGGGGGPRDMAEALEAGADAVLAASIFHRGQYTVSQIKEWMHERGIPVRRT